MMAFVTTASARNYIVEVIIFERSADSEQREESWRPDSNQVLKGRAVLQSLQQRSKTPKSLTGTSLLKRLEGSLNSGGNRVIKSGRWSLNATTYPNASTFDLSTGSLKAFLKIYKTSLIFADLNMGLVGRTPTPALNSNQQTNLQNNLQSIQNASTISSISGPLYFVNEKRRLKFKEIHYFDHPKFGAIIGVWPG